MGVPPNAEWAIYFDKNGDFIDVEQRAQKTGEMELASVKYNVATNPPPSSYQFLGAKPLGGEWHFYKIGESLHMCYHRYNCDIRCE